jgi:hypothetical protein
MSAHSDFDFLIGDWNANRQDSFFGVPTMGAFTRGRGEFFSQELFEKKSIFVRFVWTPGSLDTCRWEQAFSADGGKTWETNWIMEFRRT